MRLPATGADDQVRLTPLGRGFGGHPTCERISSCRPFVALLVGVLVLQPQSLFLVGQARADDDPGASASPPKERIEECLRELEAYRKALGFLESKIDKTRLDPTELAKSLGSDLDKCFTYVRDEVRIEPYEGLLRGAKGTLIAGAGNPLDRAALLAELIRLGGTHEVRIVHGELAAQDAKALLAEAKERLAEWTDGEGRPLEEQIAEVADAAGLDAARLRETCERLRLEQENRRSEIEAQVAEAGLRSGRDYTCFEDRGAGRNERAWSARFERVLRFLYAR